MERVQKASTNLVPQLKKYSYTVRLKKIEIGITSLKDRRLRGDITDKLKYTNCRRGKNRQIINSSSD